MKNTISNEESKIPLIEAFHYSSDSIQKDVDDLFTYAIKGGTFSILPESEFPLYAVSEALLQHFCVVTSEYIEAYGRSTLSMIQLEDRQRYSEAVKNSLETGETFDLTIGLRLEDGRFFYVRDLGRPTLTENGTQIVIILRSDVTDSVRSRKELESISKNHQEKRLQLEALIASIPGGACEIKLDENGTLVYGTNGFFKLYGYTKEQFKKEKDNGLQQVVHNKDREAVTKTIREAVLNNKLGFELEHRIVKRDGSLLWVLVCGNFVDYGDSRHALCTVIDITQRKKIEEEAHISEKRFRIALAQTDSTIFEYDIRTHVMFHGYRSAELYGIQHVTENVPESLLENKVVHPDSAEAFLDMYHRICTGAPTANCIVCTNIINEGYVWRKITMTAIFDEEGSPVQAIGFLENIDEQFKREQLLRYQSERDELTGLYNRRAMATRISEELEANPNQKGLFYIIDIDNFKSVNDLYGHMFGDFVLSESARRIAERFSSLDTIASRIGGDEFTIYIQDNHQSDLEKSCSKAIADAFIEDFTHKNISISVTCSAGVAMFPAHGTEVEELYRKADLALYEAKKYGKNKVVQFSEVM